MKFKFLPQLPRDFNGIPVLISGRESANLQEQEFLAIENGGREYVFEIRYEVHCSPFKEACFLDTTLGVGHERHFYLFELENSTTLISIELEGYFGHVYMDGLLFYVAGASELYCLDKAGQIVWKKGDLGIDGVIVEQFENNAILGVGEWDPPDGWKPFKLSKATGELIKE